VIRVRATLALVLVLSATAGAGERLRAVVRTTGAGDRELLQRVHGQASDLAVDLEEVQTWPLEPGVAEQLRVAVALAEKSAASVVFWFAAERGQLLVFVAEPRQSKLFARAIDGSGAPPSSAALESAALVVRSALQAFAAGGTIGVHWKPVETTPTANPAKRRAITGFGDVGWQFAFDGQTRFEQGFTATLGLSVAHLEVALAAAISLSDTLRDTLTTFDFSRYTLAAQAGYRLLDRRPAVITVRAGLGWAGFSRRPAAALSPAVTPEASGRLTSSFLLGPELRASWRPRSGPVALTAIAGFDWLPGAPTFVYNINGSPGSGRSLWVVQPRVGLAVGLLMR
jgi:hypothetical protein